MNDKVQTGAIDMEPIGGTSPMVQIAMHKAMAEMQARITLAQVNKRDWVEIEKGVLEACNNPDLAQAGVWEFPKGGANLTGASIRLLEEIFSRAGNFDWGLRTLATTDEGSYMEAFAMDLERNTKASKEIFVPHDAPRWDRDAKRMQKTRLTDTRDIYEHTANMGTRRLRACMEALCPKEIQHRAVQACEARVLADAKMEKDSVRKLADAFAKHGVTTQMLDKWLGYPLNKITPRRLVRLRAIYHSIVEGFAAPSDWFKGANQARVVEEKLKPQAAETPKTQAKTAEPWVDKETGETYGT